MIHFSPARALLCVSTLLALQATASGIADLEELELVESRNAGGGHVVVDAPDAVAEKIPYTGWGPNPRTPYSAYPLFIIYSHAPGRPGRRPLAWVVVNKDQRYIHDENPTETRYPGSTTFLWKTRNNPRLARAIR